MKIAITADLHLTTIAKNPERFQALSDVLKQCGKKKIQLLIIAGDLFDKAMANYSDFENIYQKHCPKGLKTIVIPGNHDQTLNPTQLIGESLTVFDKPILHPLNNSRNILFLPYQTNKSMGEAIAPFADELRGERWILIGHGDWTDGINDPDPYEIGSYMPLTRNDMALYQPELVFLGHIHLPQGEDQVFYPGSACPIKISETGRRRFLILDTVEGGVISANINTVVEYYNEHLVMVPGANDLELLLSEIQNRIQDWGVSPSREKYVQVKVEISGTASSDRKEILTMVKKLLSPYRFYRDQDPIIHNLIHDTDPDKAAIAQNFKDWLDNITWDEMVDKPSKSMILDQALKTIYGVDR